MVIDVVRCYNVLSCLLLCASLIVILISLDCNLSVNSQTDSAVKKCFFHIRNIGKIRKYIDEENCKTLVSVVVTSQLDYCNALCNGLPDSALSRLQKNESTSAKLVFFAHKFTHITQILMKLHWLLVRFRLLFKILLHLFKVLIDVSPSYFF